MLVYTQILKKQFSKVTFALICSLFLQLTVSAQIQLPNIVSNDMVLQRNAVFKLGGKADKFTKLSVIATWNKKKFTCTSDENGSWKVAIPTGKAGGPYTLTVSDGKSTIVRKNIMLGEVWICSGQSNMEWNVARGIDNGEQEAATANYPNIRMLYIPKAESGGALNDANAQWKTCTPEVMREFSAVGYFFGRKLHKELNVPIGLINCNWGGTNIEAWMSAEKKSVVKDTLAWKAFQTFNKDLSKPSSVLYNAMLYPLHIFPVAGALWYQGESNTSNSQFYKTYMQWMVEDWRKLFGDDMPFYYAQIAPYKYKKPYEGALIQEQQRFAMNAIKNLGMIVTADIAGDVSDIHPKNKLDIGERLARWALAKTYKKPNVFTSGPLYKSKKIEGNTIRIQFDYTADGLQINGDSIANLWIAGNDGKFMKALAKIEGKEVLVSNPKIENPVAVRMAFANDATVNLFNNEGLPASPFRTDDFPMASGIEGVVTLNKDNSKTLTLISKDKIFYTLDGSEPTRQSDSYSVPIQITQFTVIKAKSLQRDFLSTELFEKQIPVYHGYVPQKMELLTAPDKKYAANGAMTLYDGELGGEIFSDRTWLGFHDTDAVIKIDLGENKPIHSVTIGTLQNQNDWIFLPQYISVAVSDDGEIFKEAITLNNGWKQSEKNGYKEIKAVLPQNRNGRYIKLLIKNNEKLPDWHDSKGNPAWIFLDDVMVE